MLSAGAAYKMGFVGRRGAHASRIIYYGLVFGTLAALFGSFLFWTGVAYKLELFLLALLFLLCATVIDRYGPSWLPTSLWVGNELGVRLRIAEARQLRFLFEGSVETEGHWYPCRWVRYLPTEAERKCALFRFAAVASQDTVHFVADGLQAIHITEASASAAAEYLQLAKPTHPQIEAAFFARLSAMPLSATSQRVGASEEGEAKSATRAYSRYLGWD
jgi:hypothetical protein